MPFANLNDIISDLPRLSAHAANGEDVSADLAGLLDRLTHATGDDQKTTCQMIRGRLQAQVESLSHCNDPVIAAERAFYQRAIEQLEAGRR